MIESLLQDIDHSWRWLPTVIVVVLICVLYSLYSLYCGAREYVSSWFTPTDKSHRTQQTTSGVTITTAQRVRDGPTPLVPKRNLPQHVATLAADLQEVNKTVEQLKKDLFQTQHDNEALQSEFRSEISELHNNITVHDDFKSLVTDILNGHRSAPGLNNLVIDLAMRQFRGDTPHRPSAPAPSSCETGQTHSPKHQSPHLTPTPPLQTTPPFHGALTPPTDYQTPMSLIPERDRQYYPPTNIPMPTFDPKLNTAEYFLEELESYLQQRRISSGGLDHTTWVHFWEE